MLRFPVVTWWSDGCQHGSRNPLLIEITCYIVIGWAGGWPAGPASGKGARGARGSTGPKGAHEEKAEHI